MGTSPNMMNGDTMGLPPAIARRKNGLMQALMAIPEDDQGMGASQPSASPMGDAAPPPQAQPQSQPRQDRFMDDQPTRSQQPQSLKDKMDAGDYSDMEVGQPQQQNDHLSQLQGEYDKLGQPRPPMKLWQKIALGASAPFGGLQGFVQERNQQNERTDKQRSGVLQQIEAERRMQEQEGLADKRMTLQQQMESQREAAARDAQQPEHMDTDQGPIQWDRNAKSWTPIQVGGKPVGPKATKPDKPDSLDQQYDDAVTRGDTKRAAQIRQEKADLAAAGQAPQRDPRQLAIGPDGTVVELRPGAKVQPGTVTAGQYGPEQAKANERSATANATVNSFTRYQQSFRTLAPQLTEDDKRAMQVLTSHEQVSQGFLAKATSGVLDTMFGEPLTGYSEKAMGGIMTKDQYDKMSPAGKKMLADYFNAVIQNFGNMKQILGSIGRNPMQLQAEINTIPLPYVDQQSAETMFADKLEDVQARNKGVTFSGQGGQSSGGGKDYGAAPPGANEGAVVRNKATGQRGQVRNGRIVPLAAGQ